MEEYSDDQRENIVSIMQTVPFGGDLFDHSWPDWLSSSESGSMKLVRLCLQCPDTTDPVQFLKWFLFIGMFFIVFSIILSFSRLETVSVKSNTVKIAEHGPGQVWGYCGSS